MKEFHILNLGAGVQSTTLYLQSMRGECPRFDIAIFADTLQVDAALRTSGAVANRDMDQTMYVHRSCKPLTQIEFHPRENFKEMQLGLTGFGLECEGVCGV